LKSKSGVVQGQVQYTLLSTIVKLFDVQKCRDIEWSLKVIRNGTMRWMA